MRLTQMLQQNCEDLNSDKETTTEQNDYPLSDKPVDVEMKKEIELLKSLAGI
jgi:hypothetical protein